MNGASMYGNLTPATLDQYVAWLKGYLKRGGAPTHYYDYPFAQFGRFRYVTGMFGLEGEVGSNAYRIIVEKNATLDPRKSDLGHNVLFYESGFQSQDRKGMPAGWVPVFSDDKFLTIRGIDPHIRRLVAKKSK